MRKGPAPTGGRSRALVHGARKKLLERKNQVKQANRQEPVRPNRQSEE